MPQRLGKQAAAGDADAARDRAGVFAMTAPDDNDPFYSAKLRIARAQEHLETLETQISTFFAEKPYVHIVEPDPNGTHEIHKIRLTKPFPFLWRILATEIVEHLRASLDQVTWQTVLLATGNPNSSQAAFPFGKTAVDFENSIRRRSKDIPAQIQALIRTFEPYEAGKGQLLYMLNDMCNLSKHSLIALIGAATTQGKISGTGWIGPVEFYETAVWDRTKQEIPYARVQRGFLFQHEADFKLHVSIEYREIVTGEPATVVLDEMGREVAAVCTLIDRESRRIGLVK